MLACQKEPQESMSLRDKLHTLKEVHGDAIATILARGDADSLALEAALRNPRISVRSIFDALKDEGYAVSRDTVAKYRKMYNATS